MAGIRSNWLRLAALACLAGLASGCSMLKLGWSMGPWLAEREAQKLLLLPAKDRPRLEKEIQGLMGAFGAQGAPEMAQTCEELAALIEQGRELAAWDLGQAEMKRHWEKGTRLAIASFAPLMATSDPARSQAMLQAMKSRGEKDFSFYQGKSAEEMAEAATRRTKAWMEKWLVGSLDAGQVERLRAFHREHPAPWQVWKSDRDRNHEAFARAAGQGEAAMAQVLETWWMHPERLRSAKEQAVAGGHRQASLALAKDLFLGFSPSQKAVLCARLRAFSGDLAWIARKSRLKNA